MAEGINIKFPFEETLEGGVFAVNRTTANALKDDMIALLTTKRGNRVMRHRLFSPIFDYLHEPLDEIAQDGLRHDIRSKVEEFIPQVTIKKIKFNPRPDENILEITISFTIRELFGAEDTIVLAIPIDETDTIN